jgi:hypothetical protein
VLSDWSKKVGQAAQLRILHRQVGPQSVQVCVANKALPRDMRCFLIGTTVLSVMGSQSDASAGHEMVSNWSKKVGSGSPAVYCRQSSGPTVLSGMGSQ